MSKIDELKIKLGEVMPELHELMEQNTDGEDNVGVFLHQSINRHADENTLRLILEDVEEYIERKR